jgi:hypothetical protein
VSWNLYRPTFVVYTALRAPMHAADSQYVGLVEVGPGLIVLALLIFDHELVLGVVSIHRKGATSTVAAGVAD